MSSLVLPVTSGLKMERSKSPEWKTITHVATSGKESRTAMMSYPRWSFSIQYEFLQQDTLKTELTAFIGFYNQLQGGYDTFLYDDPYDNTVTNQAFGTGDGTSKSFQLVRNMGGFIEPLKDLNSAPIIQKDGVTTTAYTIANGIVTFTTAPELNSVLTWSGTFYFRCRFKEDSLSFDQFMFQFWELKKIEFVSVK